jgi:hypothetical protein
LGATAEGSWQPTPPQHTNTSLQLAKKEEEDIDNLHFEQYKNSKQSLGWLLMAAVRKGAEDGGSRRRRRRAFCFSTSSFQSSETTQQRTASVAAKLELAQPPSSGAPPQPAPQKTIDSKNDG